MDRARGLKRSIAEKELEEKVFGGDDLFASLEKAPKERRKKKKVKRRAAARLAEKKPAWTDEWDEDKDVRKQMPIPSWALRKEGTQLSDDDVDSDAEDQLRRTGNAKIASTSLPDTILQLRQCTDLSKDSPGKGKLTAVEFHPWARVAMTASMGHRLCIYEVDGKRNPCLTSLFIDKYPVYSAHFTSDGNEVVLGSRHRNFKVFDLNAGKIVEVPCLKSMEESNMKHVSICPDGQLMVFPGSYGNIHIFSQKSKQWIDTVKMNGEVESVAFSPDGTRMFSHGNEGEVYVWDMERRSCIHRFHDDGCLSGLSLAVSPNGRHLATGSSRAAVNLYDVETCMASKVPQPKKVFLNLRQQVTGLQFNSTSEILCMTSNYAENAIRLAHVASQTVFSNFPEPHTNTVRIPHSTAFSRNSGYLAIGLHTGKALLYRLKHYKDY